MCGIAGFVDCTTSGSPERVLRRMTDSIAHRGPDDAGFFTEAPAFLGHRRLSIIDVAAGHQPMTSESGALWIVYNGEIFNHSDVAARLREAGHTYTTRCDTETILHAYEEYGNDCVSHFRGMFAFAIWDRERRTLFCARDRLGIKPLYYFFDGAVFAFASEMKALLEHPAVRAQFNGDALGEYLALGYTTGESTLFGGIRRLLPGHTLTLDMKPDRPRLDIRRYWDVPAAGGHKHGDEREWTAELRRRLEETVRMRLMSDVPLGMFLSGGVDSSAIAGLMKRMVSGPVETFAVGYNETAYSELAWARQAADAVGTDHREVVIGMNDFFDALPKLIWHEDEPITWPSSVSLYFVSKLAASRVKVVLTGEGSDELFAGYGRYGFYQRNHGLASVWSGVPAPARKLVRSFLASTPLLRADLRRKALHTVLGREPSVESLYLDNFFSAFSASELGEWMKHPTDPYAGFLRYWESAPPSSLLGRMLYADQKTYLAELLMKQDQMSMACSIESRVPLLDHTLVEFAASIPDDMKLRGQHGKYIFKKAVEDVLPHDIIYRKKMGFPTPLKAWLLTDAAAPLYDVLTERDGFLAAHLDRVRLERLLSRHRSGQEDATDRIWRLLNLQIWADTFLTGRRERWSSGMMNAAAVKSPA